MECKLCRLVSGLDRTTRVYYEDRDVLICDCETCMVPMAVAKNHLATLSSRDIDIIVRRLTETAKGFFKGDDFYIDYKMRAIPEHWHVHARRAI